MSAIEKARHITAELKGHIRYTISGATLGIAFMFLFQKLTGAGSQSLFVVFHPGHVILSAMVTASMFRLHAVKKGFLIVLIIGYIGSVGIATLSDIIIPHTGMHILGLDLPTHSQLHHTVLPIDAENQGEQHQHGRSKIHLGFIEEWYIVNPAALIGVFIAYFFPRTKFPHAVHVLVSTWASSAYLLMNLRSELTVFTVLGIFATLFIAIWIPCTISDIVFPLLFVKSDLKMAEACPHHWLHSHNHLPQQEQSI